MGRRFRNDYLILIRAQCPYDRPWSDVLEDKKKELHTSKYGAFWFYRGNTTRPDQVRRFVAERGTPIRISFTDNVPSNEFVMAGPPLFIYFPNPLDYYKQSLHSKALLWNEGPDRDEHPREEAAVFMRRVTHDWPGQNALVLGSIASTRGRSLDTMFSGRALNLSEYEIDCGTRKGMCARKYFVDGKYGQRVACLRRTETSEPAHYVRIHLQASLAEPYASRCVRD